MKSHIYPLIALGNEAPIAAASDSLAPGLIALANESRFVSTHYSEALTQFTVGYRDPENLLAAVDYIAPPVPVGRRFEWKKADNSEAFLTETDDERAIGAGFKKVEYSGSTQLGKTANRGLTYVLDTDEDGGAVTEESVVAMLQQRIIRNKYRRAISALLALSAGTASVWSAVAQPDELMRAALATAQLDSGLFPNRGLVGLAAWNLRSAGLAAQNNAGAYAALAKTPAQVAGDLMLDDLRVDKALFQQTKTAKGRIVGSNFIGFTARDGLGKDDPSNLKQFYTPTGGGRFRVYRKV
ncbi:MAG: hypothetical protein RL376_448, partial [Verrucomicrobiota bacterium]